MELSVVFTVKCLEKMVNNNLFNQMRVFKLGTSAISCGTDEIDQLHVKAFEQAAGTLESVMAPNACNKAVWNALMHNCTKLRKIRIGSSLTSIDDNFFEEADVYSSLETVIV